MADLSLELGRKMPFSIEAEQSVLGSVLLDPDCINELPKYIDVNDFYLDEHKTIYEAMLELSRVRKSIDPVTLTDELVGGGTMDNEQSQKYIRMIAETVPTAANVIEYAKIVREKSLLRQLISECGTICDNAFMQSDTAKNIIDDAESRIFALSKENKSKDFARLNDVLSDVLPQLKKLQQEGADVNTVKTGFSSLDEKLVGMGKSDLVLIGGRPGMGKTSFALNIALQVAKNFLKRDEDKNKKVCIFSLEMSNEQVATRMLSGEAMVDSTSLRSGKLTNEDWNNIVEASGFLANCNVLIDDTTDVSTTAMRSKLRRVKNLGMIVIDYLQLMRSDRKIDNRVMEITDITRNLKLMAKEFNVPVLVCAQLSRGPEENGKGRKPVMSDLRDSGSIEQDADIIMLLYREEYYNETAENKDLVSVNVAKNRHGSTGTVNMNWLSRFTKFSVRDERYES